MKTIFFRTILVAALLAAAPLSAQDEYRSIPDQKFTSVNQIGLMINNNGFLGTNLPSELSPPSFEYPLGTDLERMIRGGIWIGAINVDNDTLVSHAAIDAYYTDPIESEFRAGPLMDVRSSLKNDPNYDPDAVSEQDYDCFFVDTDATLMNNHVPLNLKVRLKTYAWSFQPVDQFVILSYTIENIGQNRLQDLYVGMYGELISCSKSSGGSFPGQCFDTKAVFYDAERRAVGNRHFTFDYPGYAGYALLGSLPDTLGNKTVTYEWMRWDPGAASSATDPDRYRLMSSGVIDVDFDPVADPGDTLVPVDDPTELLSAGPYRFLDPGDTLNVVFAFAGGTGWDDYLFRVDWAQKTFESNYQIPEPPPSPALHVDPGPNRVRLFWDAAPETIPDPVLPDSMDFQGYRIYLSRDNLDWTLVGEYDIVDTIGFNTGFASILSDTTIDEWDYNYAYEIPNLKDGFEYWVSVTSYDRGDRAQGVPPLESGYSQNRNIIIPGPDAKGPGDARPDVLVFPNPYRGEALWDGQYPRERLIYFGNLPRLCTIRIYTIAGDLVDTIVFDAESYHALESAAVYDPDFDPPVLSGGLAAWDLLTSQDQSIASGLYVFSVEDRETGDVEVGKFLVIR
ncbi:MAG: hypothetical protein JW958_05765 [Candidatus Eisenbacteria bacterium]|nr:hypothetical protein [Candidatus Eisenbacteria bacterium]